MDRDARSIDCHLATQSPPYESLTAGAPVYG